MPQFTPPVVTERSNDFFFGRFQVQVGQSVIKQNGVYTTVPIPWMGELVGLTEGTDYFMGGRTYSVTTAVADALEADGYTTVADGFGEGFL